MTENFDNKKMKEIMKFVVFLVCIVFTPFSLANKDNAPVVFTFPEYQYKEITKNEVAFRDTESACEQSRSCSDLVGIAHLRCVRECVSSVCYKELYSQDPLEEGEIDVRLHSFKGCFIQKTYRGRS